MATMGAVVGARWAVPLLLRGTVVLLTLTGTLLLSAGCATRQHEMAPAEEETNIERPAVAECWEEEVELNGVEPSTS